MPKYDLDYKLKCINAYKEGVDLPNDFNINKKTLSRYVFLWTKLYKEQGVDGLNNSIIYKDYSLDDKKKAVKRIINGESMSSVSRSLGMRTHSTVRRWYLDYLKDGISGLQYRKGIKTSTSLEISKAMTKKLTNSEKEELLSLRKRNQILEAENEYLKKLDALVSKREKEEAKAKKQK